MDPPIALGLEGAGGHREIERIGTSGDVDRIVTVDSQCRDLVESVATEVS